MDPEVSAVVGREEFVVGERYPFCFSKKEDSVSDKVYLGENEGGDLMFFSPHGAQEFDVMGTWHLQKRSDLLLFSPVYFSGAYVGEIVEESKNQQEYERLKQIWGASTR